MSQTQAVHVWLILVPLACSTNSAHASARSFASFVTPTLDANEHEPTPLVRNYVAVRVSCVSCWLYLPRRLAATLVSSSVLWGASHKSCHQFFGGAIALTFSKTTCFEKFLSETLDISTPSKVHIFEFQSKEFHPF